MGEILEIPPNDDLVEGRRRLLHEHEVLEDLWICISQTKPFLSDAIEDLLTCLANYSFAAHPEVLVFHPCPMSWTSLDIRNSAVKSIDQQDGRELLVLRSDW